MIQLTDTLYAVEVPEGARSFEMSVIDGKPEKCKILYWTPSNAHKELPNVDLDFWDEIVGIASELTEEQCKGLVEWEDEIFGYPIHGEKYVEHSKEMAIALKVPIKQRLVSTSEAKESLQSLLESKGYDISKNYLIIQKVK